MLDLLDSRFDGRRVAQMISSLSGVLTHLIASGFVTGCGNAAMGATAVVKDKLLLLVAECPEQGV